MAKIKFFGNNNDHGSFGNKENHSKDRNSATVMSEVITLTVTLVEYSQISVGIHVEFLVYLSDFIGGCDKLNNFNKFSFIQGVS